MKLSPTTLKTFDEWEKPTYQDVSNVLEKLNLSEEQFTLYFGTNPRTVRRWKSKKTINREEKSNIPYGVWCILIALSEDKCIFSNIIKRDLSQIPLNYICSFKDFVSPPKDILTLFVGKESITGLSRTALASLFGWNPVYLGREFNKGYISYLNWVLILLFCGVDIKKIISGQRLNLKFLF